MTQPIQWEILNELPGPPSPSDLDERSWSFPMAPLSARAFVVHSDGDRIRFELPSAHAYLSSDAVSHFQHSPETSAFPPPPPGAYELRGNVHVEGHARVGLYLLQYDDKGQLQKDSTPLRSGPYRLRWNAAVGCKKILLALRLSGEGSCRMSPATLSVDAERSFEEELALADGDEPRTRVFIVGCPRSGTTLLLNMMRCFQDAAVDLSEHPYPHFALLDDPAPIHVLKRTGHCWQSLSQIPDAVRLIYMVRHPYDVLTSRHRGDLAKGYFTTVDDWLAEYRAFLELERQRGDDGLLLLRYEDLVPGTASSPVTNRIVALRDPTCDAQTVS